MKRDRSEPEALHAADAFYDAGDAGCAGPALREIAHLLDELGPGARLEIRTTSDTGRNSLRALVRMRGDTIDAEDAGPEGDRILIRKS